MLKKALTAVAVLFLCGSVSAQEAHKPGFYVGLEGGLAFFQGSETSLFHDKIDANFSFNRGYTLGATVGYDFSKYFRGEFEFNYKKTSLNRLEKNFFGHTYNFGVKGDIKNFNYMANAYLQYPLNSAIVPYLGIGVGLADVKMGKPCVYKCDGGSSSQHLLAYQLIAGMGVNVSKHVTLTMDYRYFMTRKGSFDTDLLGHPKVKMNFNSHNVMLGVRYKF